jgi:phosphotransferase system enzyme I (PtsP)
VLIEHTVAEDTEAERHRVYSAFRKMREQIDTMASIAEFARRRASGDPPDLQDVRL